MRPSMPRIVRALALAAGSASVAHAGSTPAEALRAGQDISFDLRAANIEATGAQQFNETIVDEDVPPQCIPKSRGSLDIIIDLGDIGFPGSVPVTLVGTEISPTRVQWDANVLVDQCIPVTLPDGTAVNILIRRVIMRLTGDLALTGASVDAPCGQRRGVTITAVGGDAANFVDVESYALCLVSPFTRINIDVTSIDSIGLGGDDPCPGDANGDNVVNFADLNSVLSEFGLSGAPGDFPGDVNADGVVNFADLNAALSAFGTACAS